MSIASRIQEIETHIGDVYDTIDYSYDTTGVNKNIINIPKYLKKGYIDIINNGIDTLYNNFPKVSGIGSNLSLTPTYEAPMKLNEIQGDTLQENSPTPDSPVPIQSVTGLQNVEVCGKNLFDSTIIKGVVTNTNINTDTNTRICTQDFIKVKPNTTYTLSFTSDIINQINISYFTSNSFPRSSQTNWTNNYTFSTPDNINYILITFRKSDDSNVAPSDITNIQLEVGSATTYEPYNGNTYEVNLGKNLFSSEMELGTLNNSTGLPATETNCIRTKDYIPVNPNTTYIISNNKGYQQIVYQYDSSYNLLLANTQNSSFTTTSTTKYIKLRTGVSNVENDLTSLWQLEKGSQATSFSPYFTPIELNKIGDYQDSIKKSNGKNLFDEEYELGTINYDTGALESSTTIIRTKNYQTIKPSTQYTLKVPNEVTGIILYYYNNGTYIGRTQPQISSTIHTITFTTNANANQVKWRFNSNYTTLNNQTMLNEGSTALPYEPYGKVWYVEKQIGKVVLDGSESWVAQSIKTNTTAYALSSNIGYKATGSDSDNAFINYFKGNTNGYNVDEECFWFNGNGYLRLRISNTLASTYSQFRTWLSTNKPEILYQLDTPEYTEITNTELIEDLETLYTAKSQEGTTNISITSEDLEMILNVSALKSE